MFQQDLWGLALLFPVTQPQCSVLGLDYLTVLLLVIYITGQFSSRLPLHQRGLLCVHKAKTSLPKGSPLSSSLIL